MADPLITEARLIPVGSHECVTCERCATTFAAVHPACPSCVQRQARQDAEKVLHAIGYGYDDPDSPAYMLGFVGQRQLARAHFEHPRAAGSGDTSTKPAAPPANPSNRQDRRGNVIQPGDTENTTCRGCQNPELLHTCGAWNNRDPN